MHFFRARFESWHPPSKREYPQQMKPLRLLCAAALLAIASGVSAACGSRTGLSSGEGGDPTRDPQAGGTGCGGGLAACGDVGCFDLASDAEHCGSCDTACQTGQICSRSSCVCSEGTLSCAGAC